MASKQREPEPAPFPSGAAKVYGTILLVIFAIGAFQLGDSLRGYWKTQGGVMTTARVQSFREGSNGRRKWAEARYEYTWQGQHFSGGRIALFGSPDETESILQRSALSGELISIFIDPSDPSYSVVDRNWRWTVFACYILWLIATGGGATYYYRLAIIGAVPADSRQIRRAALRMKEDQMRKTKSRNQSHNSP